MVKKEHLIEDVSINSSGETEIRFKDLTDRDEVTLEEYYKVIPKVEYLGCNQDCFVFFKEGKKGHTYFTVEMSNQFAGLTDVTATFNIVIEEDTIPNTTITKMITLLREYLNDTDSGGSPKFDDDTLLWMLRQGIDNTIDELKGYHLPELNEEIMSVSLDGNGALDFDKLNTPIFNLSKSIIDIKLTDGKSSRKISEDEHKKNENANVTYKTTDPVYFLRGKNAYVKPFDTTEIESGSIEEDAVYYVHGYTSLVYNGNNYSSGDVFTGVSGVTTYSTTGNGKVVINQYIDIVMVRRSILVVYDKDNTDLNVDCELDFIMQKIILGMAIEEWADLTKQAQRLVEFTARKIESLKNSGAIIPTDSSNLSTREIRNVEKGITNTRELRSGFSNLSI